MPRRELTWILLAGVAGFWCFSAGAASLAEAESALRAGEYDRALEAYHELQLAEPDNPEILFGLGCVQYARGASRAESGVAEEAKAAFSEAKSAFAGVAGGTAQHLAPNAAFNLANVTAREAELMPEEDLKGKIVKWREAVQAYEQAVEQYPSHAAARHNLDHARYKLKQLLQQQQEQQEQQDKPEDQPPPQVVTIFQYAGTEIPGASAVPSKNTVQLVRPDASTQGGAP